MQRNSTIGELMERKRIQDGAKEYQGHTYMDLARFDEATKHMIIHEMVHAANLTPDQLSELLRMFAADMAPKPDTINTMNKEEPQNEI